METDYHSPFGSLSLLPGRGNTDPNLRAWDAADDYLLQHLGTNPIPKGASVVILNDRFGALASALADFHPLSAGDSYVAAMATRDNLARNGLSVQSVSLCDSLSKPTEPFDYLLIKVPKTLALLEDQLCRYLPSLKPGGVVLGAGMARDIHSSTLALFEQIGGPTKTSLAKRKARLIFCQAESKANPPESPYPSSYAFPEYDLQLLNHANVFSQSRPDIGTRFLLSHLPQTRGSVRVLDLACGNGVLGICAARQNPEATVTYVDESYMAIDSARLNVKKNLPQTAQSHFFVSDCLSDVSEQAFDLIINNPPFHQQQNVHDGVARRMFKESRKVLRKGGKLVVVANRHLGYHTRLKQIFGNCEIQESNRKFVILSAEH